MPESVLQSLQNEVPSKDDKRILNFQKDGYMISVGKNSFSNEKLIGSHPHKECLWMHAMAARGSHVVLCLHGRPEPSSEVLAYAAGLALRHSHSETRTVSVSLIRDVVKPDGAGIGVWKSTRVERIEVNE